MAIRKPGRTRAAIFKTILVGRSQPSWHMEHTLLPKTLALPIFSSDALSSVAYATEQIMLVALAASASARSKVMPISIAIALLLAIVVASYLQVCKGYPSGGGAYIVAKDNLGILPALTGAAALLVDYVMTVAVSVVAGIVAIVSFAPSLGPYTVELSIVGIVLLTVANLRGVRESGALFAFPTYAFIASIMIMLVVGIGECVVSGCPKALPVTPDPSLAKSLAPITLFALLHAFSSGATALTGVEAISNAIPAFRRPQARNAQLTLAMMGALAITMFLGISYLAVHTGAVPSEGGKVSIVAQIAGGVFDKGLGFYVVQIFTTGILILAANTSFQGFPRLLAILGQDSFVPRQFRNMGDRLVYSNGIILLAGAAIVLIAAFDANLDKLIQLYIVGVFTAFTLSQIGMVRHWLRERNRGSEAARGWRVSIAINTVGAIATAVVLVVTILTKFLEGAWIAMTAMAILVVVLRSVHTHYQAVGRQLRQRVVPVGAELVNHVVLLVPDLSAATAESLGWVRAGRMQDVHVVYFPRGEPQPDIRQAWAAFARTGSPDLELLPEGAGSRLDRLLRFVGDLRRSEQDFVTVVVPELIDRPGLTYLFRRRDLLRLKGALLREPRTVVADVPVLIEGGLPVGVDALPLIPQRTVALVFASAVHDATTRAVNYAKSLGASETRAVFFAFDPKEAPAMQEAWGAAGYGIPLDVVEAPFRDLRPPMLEEVRRYTARADSVATVVMPEVVVRKWRHLLLHNQTPLFVKRLLLFEPRVILASVPYRVD